MGNIGLFTNITKSKIINPTFVWSYGAVAGKVLRHQNGWVNFHYDPKFSKPTTKEIKFWTKNKNFQIHEFVLLIYTISSMAQNR